jgi:hypothetical protein
MKPIEILPFLEANLPNHYSNDFFAWMGDCTRFLSGELTPEEIKEKDFDDASVSEVFSEYHRLLNKVFDQTIRPFADRLCQVQRENCYNNYQDNNFRDIDDILNAEQPSFFQDNINQSLETIEEINLEKQKNAVWDYFNSGNTFSEEFYNVLRAYDLPLKKEPVKNAVLNILEKHRPSPPEDTEEQFNRILANCAKGLANFSEKFFKNQSSENVVLDEFSVGRVYVYLKKILYDHEYSHKISVDATFATEQQAESFQEFIEHKVGGVAHVCQEGDYSWDVYFDGRFETKEDAVERYEHLLSIKDKLDIVGTTNIILDYFNDKIDINDVGRAFGLNINKKETWEPIKAGIEDFKYDWDEAGGLILDHEITITRNEILNQCVEELKSEAKKQSINPIGEDGYAVIYGRKRIDGDLAFTYYVDYVEGSWVGDDISMKGDTVVAILPTEKEALEYLKTQQAIAQALDDEIVKDTEWKGEFFYGKVLDYGDNHYRSVVNFDYDEKSEIYNEKIIEFVQSKIGNEGEYIDENSVDVYTVDHRKGVAVRDGKDYQKLFKDITLDQVLLLQQKREGVIVGDKKLDTKQLLELLQKKQLTVEDVNVDGRKCTAILKMDENNKIKKQFHPQKPKQTAIPSKSKPKQIKKSNHS